MKSGLKARISALLLCALALSFVQGFILSNAQDLSDVSGTTYEVAINYLVGEGVVEGYPDGTYKPDQTINRAELLKIILEASDTDTSGASNDCFPDVQGDDWYVKYVCTAQETGVVEGYPDGTFKPAQTVNFVEALKITLLGYGFDAGTDSEPWYKKYVDTASGYNMIPLEISAFAQDLSRGEMADMITRLNKSQDGSQSGYLLAAFGTEGETVVDYDTIVAREGSSTPALTPGPLTGVTIETFSTDVPALQTMEFTAALTETETDVTAAVNYDEVMTYLNLSLSSDQQSFLQDNKFLLVPLEDTDLAMEYVDYDEMLGAFDEIGGEYSTASRSPENAKLVTPDVVLHAFHKFFENSLEKIEKEQLGASLRSFIEKLQQKAVACISDEDAEIAERCENLAAQLTVAHVLIENAQWDKPLYFDTPDDETTWETNDETVDSIDNAKTLLAEFESDFSAEMYAAIEQELEDVYAANGLGQSPLFIQYYEDLVTDYTQFTPRSHYTKTSSLRAYFRTMMYLGRSSYFFDESELGVKDTLLLTYLMSSDQEILDLWTEIMQVTGFYAGQADDIVYDVWANYVSDTLGDEELSLSSITDQELLDELILNLNELEPPQILSDIIVSEEVLGMTKEDLLNATKGFRIFGQRFTYDAWILNSLTAGQEMTDVDLPSTPSALFVNAAFGDSTAKDYAGDFLMEDAGFSSAQIEAFNGKLDEVTADISAVTDEDWLLSMGAAWLDVLGTLTDSYGSGYPMYMQSDEFLNKQIQTFLGSYTELKHDTLLYAKQSYAELGAGWDDGEAQPVVKGFVEPNMEFWYKLQRLVDYTHQGFEEHEMLEDQIYKLDTLSENILVYTEIAEKELKGEALTEEDYENIRITDLEWIAEPMELGGGVLDEEDKRVSMIADIHTDAVREQILYEATGIPYVMIAFVANDDTPRLTIGLAFNHYELTGPLDARYTDQDWQEWVYDTPASLPDKNFWYEGLIVN